MSLTNSEKENLRRVLNEDTNLTATSKTALNTLINNSGNQNKTEFLKQYRNEYNKLRRRNKDFKSGIKRRRGGNVSFNNSAKQNSGTTSIARTVSGPIYVAKRPKLAMSPTGPLSMESNSSNASNFTTNTATSNRSNSNRKNRIARERAAMAAIARARTVEAAKAAKNAENQRKRNEAAKAAKAAKNAENQRKRNEAAKATKNAENQRKRNEAAKAAKNAENQRKRNEAAKATKNAENQRKRNEAAKATKNTENQRKMNNLKKYLNTKKVPTEITNKYLQSIRTNVNFNKLKRNVNNWIKTVPGTSTRTFWNRATFPTVGAWNKVAEAAKAYEKQRTIANVTKANQKQPNGTKVTKSNQKQPNGTKNANVGINLTTRYNNNTITDIIDIVLSKEQLIAVARELTLKVKSSATVPVIKEMLFGVKDKAKLAEAVNNQFVDRKEESDITTKVNMYVNKINNNNQSIPPYTASLLILYIKDLTKDSRQKILQSDGKLITTLMNAINSKMISNTSINYKKSISSEEFTDLVFIMWLDGIHDNYVKESLNVWFKNSILFTDAQKTKVIAGWNTTFIDKINELKIPTQNKKSIDIRNASPSNFPTGWEKKVKNYLIEKYKNTKMTVQTTIPLTALGNYNTKVNINIAVDQELYKSLERSITSLITKFQSNNKVAVNTLITYGQAFDPGRYMVSGAIHNNVEKLTLNNLPTNFNRKGKKYYLCDLNVDLKVGKTSVFNLVVGKDKSNVVIPNFNSKRFFTNTSKGVAQKAGGDILSISKYFGDALQYYYLAGMDDITRTGGTLERFFFGSGDSMALLGYQRVCEILGKNVRMVIDDPEQSNPRLHIIGLSPETSIQRGAFSNTTRRTGTTTTQNIKNTARSR